MSDKATCVECGGSGSITDDDGNDVFCEWCDGEGEVDDD